MVAPETPTVHGAHSCPCYVLRFVDHDSNIASIPHMEYEP